MLKVPSLVNYCKSIILNVDLSEKYKTLWPALDFFGHPIVEPGLIRKALSMAKSYPVEFRIRTISILRAGKSISALL